jgi:hypothetical protein
MIHYDGPVKFTYRYAGSSDEVHVVVEPDPVCTCCDVTDPAYGRLDLPTIGYLAGNIDVEIRDPLGNALTTESVLEAVQAALDASQELHDVKVRVEIDESGFEIHIDGRRPGNETSGNGVR